MSEFGPNARRQLLRRPAALLAGLLTASVPALAAGQSCPTNTYEVSRQQVGSKLTLRCACVTGYVLSGGTCLHLDDAVRRAALPTRMIAELFLGADFPGENLWRLAATGTLNFTNTFMSALASLSGQTGAFTPALTAIELVSADAAREPAVASAKQKATALERKNAQLFTLMRPEAGRAMRELAINHLSPKGQAAFMLGVANFRLGHHEQALKYLADAQATAPGDKGIDEALIIVRAAQRTREEQSDPVGSYIGYAWAFRGAGAQAAYDLAAQLASAGDLVGANAAMSEAARRIAMVPGVDKAQVRVFTNLAESMKARSAAGDRSLVAPPGKRFFDGRSKADLMLTALEYGQKDWARSLQFLHAAREADPSNATIDAAYRELKAIADTAR